jgi:hypothetical protein
MYLDGSRMLHERACAIGLEEYFYTFVGEGHVPYIGDPSIMTITLNFIRDFLVKQMGCNDAELQPENAPSETAFLYPIDDCDGNPIDDECTSSGISELSTTEFLLFPNPAQNDINIESSQAFTKIELYNILGKRVLSSKGLFTKTAIDLSELQSGSYLIRLFYENGLTSGTKLIEINK